MITFKVKVILRSRSNEIVGWEQGTLKVRLAEVPEKGKANKKSNADATRVFTPSCPLCLCV